MTLTTTIECPHGMKVTTVEDPREDYAADPTSGASWRRFIRETLLACPRCRLEAEGFIEAPGP